MGGPKKSVIARLPRWVLPVEITFVSLFISVGIFEAAVYLLGITQGSTSLPVAIIGAVYFALPFVLLRAGVALPARFLHLSEWQKYSGILLLNLPFILYLYLQGNVAAKGVLLVIVLAQALFALPHFNLRTKPVLDVLSIALCMTGPFLYGVLLAGVQNTLWVPAFLTGVMISIANYLMYKLPTIGLEARMHSDGTAVRLGVDRAISVVLSLYIVATILPVLAYGLAGAPASILLLWYVVVALQAVPFRYIAGSAGLYRVWRAIWLINYPIMVFVLLYAWFALSR